MYMVFFANGTHCSYATLEEAIDAASTFGYHHIENWMTGVWIVL
jgi:hypothetical protein